MRDLTTRRLATLGAAVLTMLAACNGGSDDGISPPAAAITIAVAPTTLSITQGGNGTATITLTRTNFTGAVNLVAEGLPTGVTASFNPASVPNGTTTSILTLTAAAGATPVSAATVTVRATGTGVTDKTATIAVTVTVAGAYTLSASPATLSIAQGGTGSSTVNITRTGGFAGSIALAVTGAPTGVTATLNPTSTTANTSTLSVTVAGTTTPGTYTLTVTGTVTGLANQTTTVGLTVSALSSTTVSFCAADTPVWFAYQNEGGAWMRVAAGANSSFTFSSTPKVAIAAVTGSAAAGYDLLLIHATTTELQGLTGALCNQLRGPKQLYGTIAGVSLTEAAQVVMGSSSAFATNPPGTFSLDDLPNGALDLVAARFGLTLDLIPNKLIVRRAVNLANQATIPVLDFSAGEAFNPASATLTLSGVGSDEATVLGQFITGGGTTALLYAASGVGASSTVYGVPAAQLGTGDIHQFDVAASGRTSNDLRGVLKYVRNITAMAIDLHPALNSPTMTTVATSPYARLRVQLASQTDYNAGIFASITQTGGAAVRSANILMTSGYLGSTPTTWDVTIPDLTGVTGFDANWGLKPSTATEWMVMGFGGSLNALFVVAPTDGLTLNYATREGAQSTAARATQVTGSALSRARSGVSGAWPWLHTRKVTALPNR